MIPVPFYRGISGEVEILRLASSSTVLDLKLQISATDVAGVPVTLIMVLFEDECELPDGAILEDVLADGGASSATPDDSATSLDPRLMVLADFTQKDDPGLSISLSQALSSCSSSAAHNPPGFLPPGGPATAPAVVDEDGGDVAPGTPPGGSPNGSLSFSLATARIVPKLRVVVKNPDFFKDDLSLDALNERGREACAEWFYLRRWVARFSSESSPPQHDLHTISSSSRPHTIMSENLLRRVPSHVFFSVRTTA